MGGFKGQRGLTPFYTEFTLFALRIALIEICFGLPIEKVRPEEPARNRPDQLLRMRLTPMLFNAVFGLDIAIDEGFGVDIFDTRDQLVGKQKDRL
jgi:hypothetical protein